MKILKVLILTIVAGGAAYADFSYITVTKTSMGERTSKHYLKGQKLITEDGDRVTVMDLDAQTMTTINKAQKSYSVKTFSQISNQAAAAGMKMNADLKKTGQHKTVNGFDTEEMVMTMNVDTAQSKAPAKTQMQMQMEMHFWMAADVPGIEEMRTFYQKNADRMPWGVLGQGNNSMAEMQRKLASMHGIPVLTTMKMKSNSPEMDQKMAAARAQMEALKAQGGQQAAMAEKMLAQMGGGSGFDMTSESSGFSDKAVSDSVFAIPADYKKVE